MNKNQPYHIEPKNKFFEAIRAAADFELRPGPSVSFLGEVDLTQIDLLRQKSTNIHKPSYTAFVAKAIVLSLKEFPYANRRVCRLPNFLWLKHSLQSFHQFDVAFGIERNILNSESVAFLDVIRNVDSLTVAEISSALRSLAEADGDNNPQWRSFNKIINGFPSWISNILIRLPNFFPQLWVKYRGGAVLISSPTKYGIDAVLAKQAHAVSVAFGIAKLRPVVKEGVVVPCLTFSLTLNFDRRVMAGAQGARFFKRIIDILERADFEMN